MEKSRLALKNKISRWLAQPGILPEEFWKDWEAALIQVDLGVKTAQALVEGTKDKVEQAGAFDPAVVREKFEEELLRILDANHRPLVVRKKWGSHPTVIMVVGVNGTGKTTTIAKLAYRFQQSGNRVLLSACDTFRAAAIEQLQIWAQRVGADLIQQQYGGDPAAVAFDALTAARSRGHDYLIIDTAGRLHTRSGLLAELQKIARVLGKIQPDAPQEVFLILDASVGQNGLVQARKFMEMLPLTGVVLTKLDGTARGGIVVSIQEQLGLPVVALGVGEELDDLLDFEPQAFVQALLEG